MSVNSDAREQRPWDPPRAADDDEPRVPQQRHAADDVDTDDGAADDVRAHAVAVPQEDLRRYDEDLTRMDRDLDPAMPHPADVADDPARDVAARDDPAYDIAAHDDSAHDDLARDDAVRGDLSYDDRADDDTAVEDEAVYEPEQVAVDDAGTTYASSSAVADGPEPGDGPVARATAGLKPGEAPQEPVAELWDEARSAEFRDRWRDAQLSFVDDPRAAVDQVKAVVGEAVELVTSALAQQRDALDADLDAGDDTERLRMVIRRYRVFFDRVLDL